ncbi:flagellar basal-body rod modification protein FlgD [Desulfacinum hydrothermale DSM 13146]|uniref:Basal-body rod modification protein FlgD n=1 Tax=Desulfacinum hydrothermale DSM 13146 TaxID=1121390 RepID=A0A1W1X5Y3_9BACT|nr:FlgD immunoglobulin-like domain containing protein [Desulfacinum hydrothermale]SMC19250.1 flagellar basal-body rod modification protein FlgD [Desulfacinum hydrothermale DSM 13146]
MAVQSVTPTPSIMTDVSGSETVAGKALSDMNAFLLLFTTQLQHQDPTNPMDASDMSAQLAQFSTVEKLTQIHGQLETQQNYLASINNAQGLQFLGKTVSAAGNGIQVADGQISEASVELEKPANVTVTILDESGNAVRTLALGDLEAGRHEIAWDATDDAGNSVPDGIYTFEVTASANGTPVTARSLIKGDVYGFRMEDGISYLVLDDSDGLRIPVSSVVRIETSEPAV